MPSSLLLCLSNVPHQRGTKHRLTWRDAALTNNTSLCYTLVSQSDRATEKVCELLRNHTDTQIHNTEAGREWDKPPPPPRLQKQKKLRWHSGKMKRIVGYYFGLWVRCLNDELKKKIWSPFLSTGWREKESPQQICWRQTPHVGSSGGGRSCPTHTRTHRLTSEDRWRCCCCSWGQTLTHSNTAEETPPDRWSVKIGLLCAFQQKAVWFCHIPA